MWLSVGMLLVGQSGCIYLLTNARLVAHLRNLRIGYNNILVKHWKNLVTGKLPQVLNDPLFKLLAPGYDMS